MAHPDNAVATTTDVPFWLTPPSYWIPEHIVFSAWLTHAPFAFWLMDALRPRSVAELGSHHGFSLFVFAEAAKRLGERPVIHALDSWRGDDHAGFYGEDVFESVRRIATDDYPDTVRLLRGYFTESRPSVEDGSVDLLHIDGRHAYEDVRADYEEWISAVAENGIVIFHDVTEHRTGFGVYRFWEELTARHPSFTFEHGHGLGVLAPRGIPSGPLELLLTADAATADRIRTDFERLGEVVAERWEQKKTTSAEQVLREKLEEQRARAEEQRARAERLLAEVHDRDRTIAGMRESTSWRVTAPLRAVTRGLRRH